MLVDPIAAPFDKLSALAAFAQRELSDRPIPQNVATSKAWSTRPTLPFFCSSENLDIHGSLR